jgi:hypothetical protein
MQVVDANGNVFGQGLEITSVDGKPKVPVINTDITIGTTAIVGGTVGRVLFEGAGNVVQESGNLFWDNANGRLGVGTSTPASSGGGLTSLINIYRAAGNSMLTLTVGTNAWDVANVGGTGLWFIYNNSVKAILFNNGNLAIGTTTDAGFKLDVNGTARVQGVLTATADAVVNGVNVGIGGGSGATNTRVGVNALRDNTTGSANTAFGRDSLRDNTTGSNNTANGFQALYLKTTGGANTAFGFMAGRFLADGVTNLTIASNSVFIGASTKALADNQSNQIVIGHNAIGLGSNTTVIGNTSTTHGRWYGSLLLGTTTNAASSILTMDSTTQGFLSPRMTTTEKNAIASPAAGLMVYDNTLNRPCFYNGTFWITL